MLKTDPAIETEPLRVEQDNPRNKANEPKRGALRSTLMALGQFGVAVVFAPLVLVRGRRHAESVVVYAAHPSFFLWLLILTGFTGAWVVNRQWVSPEIAGWAF